MFARSVGTTAPYEVLEVSDVSQEVAFDGLCVCVLLTRTQIHVPLWVQTDDHIATVNPNDYIIGDLNGVVCIPHELIKDTIAILGPRTAADHEIARDIQAGMKFSEARRRHRAPK